jgi:TatA/E family protein of Tat protein translocase
VVFLILESLGSTELLFILVMALVFFGPRKLPQLSRSLGKNIADFRRASEDFKRTWNREVSLEESSSPVTTANGALAPEQNSILDNQTTGQTLQTPTIEVVPPDRVIARHSIDAETINPADESGASGQGNLSGGADESSPKHDWL